MPPFASRLATERGWVDPLALPDYMDPADVAGNAPLEVKRLTLNTLGAYGVGDQHSFAYTVGRRIKLVEINVEPKGDRWEATTVAEVPVTRGTWWREGCGAPF